MHSLYAWIKRHTKPEKNRVEEEDQSAEVRRLRADMKRVMNKQDILKRPPCNFPRRLAEIRLIRQQQGIVWFDGFA